MRWQEWLNTRPGTVIGTLVGILLGVLYLIVGFWKMFVFAMIVSLCCLIGNFMDPERMNVVNQWLDWWQNRRKRF